MKLNISKPIVFFDCETTGLDLTYDRIIEINMIKINLDKSEESLYYKINPQGRPISKGAFGKHGIKDEDLLECPKFPEIANSIKEFISGCDFAGYNCKKFDIPILIEEFLRCKIPIGIKDFKIVDVFKLITKAEPRTLESMYKRFLNKPLQNAHSAEADIKGTIELLDAIQEFYGLPETTDELDKYAFEDDDTIDFENKLKKQDGIIIFNFGKYKGQPVAEVFKHDRSYFDWIINSDITLYTKSIFINIVNILSHANK